MENASKALIIAGAILLSILIIALGMFILTKATSSADVSTALTENEIQAFNKKFENYAGNQLGSNVISLISVARSTMSANTQTQSGTITMSVTLQNDPTAANNQTAETLATFSDISNVIQRNHTYNVTFNYDADTALVNEIIIDYTP